MQPESRSRPAFEFSTPAKAEPGKQILRTVRILQLFADPQRGGMRLEIGIADERIVVDVSRPAAASTRSLRSGQRRVGSFTNATDTEDRGVEDRPLGLG